jgi:hypothetical protein
LSCSDHNGCPTHSASIVSASATVRATGCTYPSTTMPSLIRSIIPAARAYVTTPGRLSSGSAPTGPPTVPLTKGAVQGQRYRSSRVPDQPGHDCPLASLSPSAARRQARQHLETRPPTQPTHAQPTVTPTPLAVGTQPTVTPTSLAVADATSPVAAATSRASPKRGQTLPARTEVARQELELGPVGQRRLGKR